MRKVNKGLTALLWCFGAGFLAFKSIAHSQERSTEFPTPRNPDIAIQEQYDFAIAQGTVSAYTLFIQRYPHHKLADKLQKMMRKRDMKTP